MGWAIMEMKMYQWNIYLDFNQSEYAKLEGMMPALIEHIQAWLDANGIQAQADTDTQADPIETGEDDA